MITCRVIPLKKLYCWSLNVNNDIKKCVSVRDLKKNLKAPGCACSFSCNQHAFYYILTWLNSHAIRVDWLQYLLSSLIVEPYNGLRFSKILFGERRRLNTF